MSGWIKLHRKLLDSGLISKPKHLQLWVILLLKANHSDHSHFFNGQQMTIRTGQILTGRKSLSKLSGIPETTIERILKTLENGHQIEQQTFNKFRIITIKNWDFYQNNENGGQKNGQQTDNKRTHLKNVKNEKKKTCSFFDNFWQKFNELSPSPVGSKQNAKKQWQSITKQVEPEDIIRGLKTFAANHKELKRRGEFVPNWKHCERWLKGREFDCEPLKSEISTFDHEFAKTRQKLLERP